jgi:pimeloyl-ACP methyl ester carboxylesterase
MISDRMKWFWRGKAIDLGLESRGQGPVILMLPALSSISSRSEMRPLAEQLASAFTTIAVDWPGFGDRPRPAVAWEPDTYRVFLAHILQQLPKPTATVAAGHAAGYLLTHAAEHPGSAGRLCLIAPTWRGPLPTMMGGRRRAIFRSMCRLVDLPVIGPALYRINVNQPMIRMMARGHVYADSAWLDQHRLAVKLAVINAPGARHASFRFVAGELDPMPSRELFLASARRVTDPILVVYGAATPRRSKAEMEALRNLPQVESRELPFGKLAVHEEFPALVADAVRLFLGENSGRGQQPIDRGRDLRGRVSAPNK